MISSLPDEIEDYRDARWQRDGSGRVETAAHAERFIERVGFAACLTDSTKPGPSLFIAVCGRRDAIMPRHPQKDPEATHAWNLKDEIMRHGRVYYGKVHRGRSLFIAPRMIPYFNALWGMPRRDEKKRLSRNALAVLRVLRKEWEMATSDLRAESGVVDRKTFTQAIDELQKAMIVIPTELIYKPKFTCLWGLAEERFAEQLAAKISRQTALTEIARCFLSNAGLTIPGELARVTGLSRPDAGLGNRALVKEAFATMIAPGTYRLAGLISRPF